MIFNKPVPNNMYGTLHTFYMLLKRLLTAFSVFPNNFYLLCRDKRYQSCLIINFNEIDTFFICWQNKFWTETLKSNTKILVILIFEMQIKNISVGYDLQANECKFLKTLYFYWWSNMSSSETSPQFFLRSPVRQKIRSARKDIL